MTYRAAYDVEEKLLRAQIEQVRTLIKHNAESGGLVEGIFLRGLERVVPDKIGITSGSVTDSFGGTSKQLDIILYDRLNSPRMFADEGVAVLPVECTYAAGEVKTTVDKKALEDTFDKCSSYKALKRDAVFKRGGNLKETYNIYGTEDEVWPSLFFLLGVQSNSLGTLREHALRIAQARGLTPRGKIDTICILSEPEGRVILNGVSAEGIPQSGLSFAMQPGQSWCSYPAKSPWALFLMLLIPLLVQAPPTSTNLTLYPMGDAL